MYEFLQKTSDTAQLAFINLLLTVVILGFALKLILNYIFNWLFDTAVKCYFFVLKRILKYKNPKNKG